MQGIGSFLVLLGAGSFALHFINIEFRLLNWVDIWGVGVGNGIRIAFIVVGALIWFFGRNEAEKEAPPA